MVYTLSSPTVLAVDAACRPGGLEVLETVAGVFRLSPDGVTQLGLGALDTGPAAFAEAWAEAERVDGQQGSTLAALAARAADGLPPAALLARTRLGGVRDVAGLVLEAAPWPDPERVLVGDRLVPASAAGAAGAVAAAWVRPVAEAAVVGVLREPWRTAARTAARTATVPVADRRSARTGQVQALLARAGTGTDVVEGLAGVGWPRGAWARAMHAAAWAAYATGRLRAQLLAVLDVTAALLRTDGDLDPVLLRSALPTLHALTVADLLADVLDDATLGDLRLGAAAL